MSRGRWASEAEFEKRKDAAARVWARQKARRVAGRRDRDGTVIDAGVDIGEGAGVGAGVDARAMIQRLAEIAEEQQLRVAYEKAHRAAQAVARGLGDGSVVAEQTGARIVRVRTERMVPVRLRKEF